MAKIKLNGLDVELSLDELEDLMKRMSKNSNVTEPLQNGKGNDTWHWNDEAVKEVADGCYGKSEKLLRAFVDHGRELKYKDFCKYPSRGGLQLVGPLSAARRRVDNASGY